MGAKWHKQDDGAYVVSLGRFAITSWKWPFPKRKSGILIYGFDNRMHVQMDVSVEEGLQGKVFLVFQNANLAHGVAKQIDMFRKQVASHKRLRELVDKIQMHVENTRLSVVLNWSRHDVLNFYKPFIVANVHYNVCINYYFMLFSCLLPGDTLDNTVNRCFISTHERSFSM